MDILIPIYIAITSRMCGSRLKWFGLFLFIIPYCLAMPDLIYTIPVAIWCFAWKITGHADAFKDYVRNNTLSKVVIPLTEAFGIERDSQTYDAVFWAVKGGLIALLPAIILGNIWFLILSIVGYPYAYYLGYNVLPKRYIEDTAWGEFLAGFISGLGFLFI